MSILKYFCFSSLIISYGYLLVNLTKGNYKKNVKKLFIDIWIAYFLAPLISITLIWGYVDKIKMKTFKINGRS